MFDRLKVIVTVLAIWALLQPGALPAAAQDRSPAASDDADDAAPRVRRRRYETADTRDTPRGYRGAYDQEPLPRGYRSTRSSGSKPRRPPYSGPRGISTRTASYQDAPETLPAPPPPAVPTPTPAMPGRSLPGHPLPGAPDSADVFLDPFDDGPHGHDGHDMSYGGHGGPQFDGHYDGYFDGAPGCDDGCCDSCGPCWMTCGPIYIRTEALMWWMKGDSLPPLVTTSPTGTARAAAGVLGQPNTSILFGGDTVNNNLRGGGRVVAGWWLDPLARVEAEFFAIGQQWTQFDQSSTGSPILARPFFNAQTGAQDSNVIAYPGQVAGTVRAASMSGSFLGTGIHATQNMRFVDYGCDRQGRIDFLYGFRYLYYQDALQVIGVSTSTSGVTSGTYIAATDNFRTTNNFYGLDLGLSTDHRLGRWCFTTVGRVAVGGTTEHININGNTVTTTPGVTTATTTSGGLLTQPTNIGVYNHSGFTVVPQLELKLNYDITPRWRATVGYDIIYWSRVAMASNQVSTVVNTSQAGGGTLTGAPAPQFTLRESDLWVQGLNLGLEFKF